MMTKEETWKRLIKLGAVNRKMPEGRWNLQKVDLHRASLIEANFSQAILLKANLQEADFSGANFSGANLRGANLQGVDFIRATFHAADLTGADLRRANLRGADFRGAELLLAFLQDSTLSEADLTGTDISGAKLNGADLSGAKLNGATLTRADFIGVELSGANLTKANLEGATLIGANLSDANLTGANLSYTLLVDVNFERAKLNNCQIYGVSAWDLNLQEAEQSNLIITPEDQPVITIDNLKVAQFIYLLLNNPEIRDVLDTIASKVVLILGRFIDERKSVLEALRNELRQRNYIPILFDFPGPKNRNITETISTLAHMARFVIADITDPRSIPQELMAIIPRLPSVPIQPLLQGSFEEYGMFKDFKSYPWVLPIYHYKDIIEVLASLPEKIISPAEARVRQQKQKTPL